MFPTTIWTSIGRAGGDDPQALDEFARRYRAPVLQFIHRKGFRGADADDVCQDVFVRVIRGGVLAKADPERGRFRSLLLAVATRTIQDRLRKRRDVPVEGVDRPEAAPEFDRAWAWHLTQRALEQLQEEGSPYYEVLEAHLGGRKQDRKRLWHARRKLAALVRREIAYTCASREDYLEELAYLARYLGGDEDDAGNAEGGGT